MSEVTVEIVRSQNAAPDQSRWFDVHDWEIVLGFTRHPVPDSAVIRGKEEAIHWFRRWWATRDDCAACKVVRIEIFLTREEALEAAGLSE